MVLEGQKKMLKKNDIDIGDIVVLNSGIRGIIYDKDWYAIQQCWYFSIVTTKRQQRTHVHTNMITSVLGNIETLDDIWESKS